MNEKINYLKFYTDTTAWSRLSDKYAVRAYIAERGFGDTLVGLIGRWDDAHDIDWDRLPQQFVMKCNNGSGDVVVCTDKRKLDVVRTTAYFDGQLHRTYGTLTGETHYAHIRPCVIAEELLDSSTQPNGSRSLVDYKIWSFDGRPAYVVCYSNRHDQYFTEIGVYDTEWNEHREYLRYSSHYQPERRPMPRPDALARMLDMAAQLSAGFPQVRVDLYEVDGKVYFGELTFTSSGGYMAHFSQDFLDLLGRMCVLPAGRG